MSRITMALRIVMVMGLIGISVNDVYSQPLKGLAMKAAVKGDEDMERVFEDIINRRILMSPEHHAVTSTSRTFTVKLHNSTKDTLVMNMYLSDTTVAINRFVYSEESITKMPDKKMSGNKLVKDNPADSNYSIYRPMKGWVKGVPKTIALKPGESQEISLTIEVPDDIIPGEYVSWVVAEVQPKRNIPEAKVAAYTISKVKISYKSEAKSTQ